MVILAMFYKYAQYYDVFNYDKPYDTEISFVYEWADKPRSIIDIGCGTANYWDYYPAGTEIIGIEKSRYMGSKADKIICADITNYKTKERFDCATALFNVINYIPSHGWWKNIPVKPGGFFIFDIYDKKKVDIEGFKETEKVVGGFGVEGIRRIIKPSRYDGKSVNLNIQVYGEQGKLVEENHRLYIYSLRNIEKFCGDNFKIVDVKPTNKWQTWYKLLRK